VLWRCVAVCCGVLQGVAYTMISHISGPGTLSAMYQVQCVVVCCSSMWQQCVALCCSASQTQRSSICLTLVSLQLCTRCSVLQQHVAVCCSVLKCVAAVRSFYVFGACTFLGMY